MDPTSRLITYFYQNCGHSVEEFTLPPPNDPLLQRRESFPRRLRTPSSWSSASWNRLDEDTWTFLADQEWCPLSLEGLPLRPTFPFLSWTKQLKT